METSDATETELVSPGSVVVSTPAVGHYADASLPLVNWSFDSELGFFSLHSFVKREEVEVVGTCFVVVAAVVVAVVGVAVVVVAAAVDAAVEEFLTIVVVVVAAAD